jgi:hypothetical protein
MSIKMHHKRFGLGFALLLVLPALSCGGGQKPIDGKTRLLIDSITAVAISAARTEVDSLCLNDRQARLPYLVDSIRQQRQREIDKKLEGIPR